MYLRIRKNLQQGFLKESIDQSSQSDSAAVFSSRIEITCLVLFLWNDQLSLRIQKDHCGQQGWAIFKSRFKFQKKPIT